MIINDFGFGRRFIAGGDIGIAEAYLRGEWETPDLTRFLLLFCVNHDLIETMLEHRPFVRLWQRLRHLMNRNTTTSRQAQHLRPLRPRKPLL